MAMGSAILRDRELVKNCEPVNLSHEFNIPKFQLVYITNSIVRLVKAIRYLAKGNGFEPYSDILLFSSMLIQ